ncbi:hypothetical protein [Peribacillus sp. FSL M8-0224]|nr:hypothetical protein KY492_17670 [Brevibacterium sp. PAMC21349]
MKKMYLIKWIENGETKTFVAEGHIEHLAYQEKLEERNITFSTEAL